MRTCTTTTSTRWRWTVMACALAACGDDPGPAGDARDADSASDADNESDTEASDTASPDAAPTETFVEPTCTSGTIAWTRVDLTMPELAEPDVKGLTGVAYGNGLFVATAATQGVDRLVWVTSPDGATCTAHTQALDAGTKHLTVSQVHYLDGRFVFFGTHFGVGNYVYTSRDGAHWDVVEIDKGPGVIQVGEFASSGELVITAGASNDMRRSSDYAAWTPQNVTDGSFGYNDLAFGDGLWIAPINVGVPGVFASEDGLDWSPIVSLAPHSQFRIEYGRGLWVLTPQAGTDVWTSPDGGEWTMAQRDPPSGGSPRFAGGRFIVQSTDVFAGTWSATASTDGVHYERLGEAVPAPAVYVTDVAFGNCHYVAAGATLENGVTMQASVLVSPAAPAP